MNYEPAAFSVTIIGGGRRRKVVVVTGGMLRLLCKNLDSQMFLEEMNKKKNLSLIYASQ